jgi:uncharacterized protein (DUF305 family)
MKKISFLFLAAIWFITGCADNNGKSVSSTTDTIPGATSSAPSAPIPDHHSTALQSIMDSTVIRMGRMELTNNPTKDFAMLMLIHHGGGRKLVHETLENNTDSGIAKLAKSIEVDLEKEIVQLNRFVIDKRYQKKQNESKASNELMKAMTPASQTSSPTSDSKQEEFPRIMITYFQTANDMVQVMEDNGADYEISGFAQEMVARNKSYIEQLKQLAIHN